MVDNADAIIVGGGIHGASLAFHLAKRGLKVIVLEKNFLASGATGRSSGLVRMHYDLELESRLAWISFQYFRNWSEMVGGSSGFVRTGFLQLVSNDAVEKLKANVKMHQEIGIPAFLVDRADVARLAPTFFTGDIELAAFESESGYADPSGCTASFLNAARRMGAQLVQDCEVTEVMSTDNRVMGVRTSSGDFASQVVVNAAGAWAGKLAEQVGLSLPIDSWQHDTMFIRRPKELQADHPTVIDFPNSMYFRPETGGLTLVGLEDNNPLGESPDGNTENSKPGFVDRAVDRICKRIPGIEHGSLHSSHGGYDGITPDQRAIIGQAGPEGFYLSCGFSGTGFKIAPAVGSCLAELIIDGRSEAADITPFHPDRFTQGKLLTGRHSYESIWR